MSRKRTWRRVTQMREGEGQKGRTEEKKKRIVGYFGSCL